jgi:hypothetical protein
MRINCCAPTRNSEKDDLLIRPELRCIVPLGNTACGHALSLFRPWNVSKCSHQRSSVRSRGAYGRKSYVGREVIPGFQTLCHVCN